MNWCLVSAAILLIGGLVALFASGRPRLSLCIGTVSAVVASLIGLVPVWTVLVGGEPSNLNLPWSMPLGGFHLALDTLSAFFLVPILLLTALAAVYGQGYLRHAGRDHAFGSTVFFFNLLTASMMFVVLSRNGLLFLMAWEVMSLSSFFLVTFESEKATARDAGWTYLIATHLGTAFLVVLFILMGRTCGSLDFDRFGSFASTVPHLVSLAFVLALIGFGTKAGFVPMHVWLPEAHPAAPSHVSAVMSGVMIKTGIYGLVRFIFYLGPPQPWWGWVLVGVGLSSGILGVLFALAQHDLKRLLAYHSVENVGIIALGLGVGLVGLSGGVPALAVLGFAGALLHVVNHALFKGLLFMGAGSVLHGTRTAELESLGGLLKKMPWTGAMFLVGSAAIVGLPPLNGFVSEFLIYLGAFRGILSTVPGTAAASVGVIAGLALIGGLALACFAKAFGIVFLGEPRSDHARNVHESCWSMRVAMLILAASCVLVGLVGPVIVVHLVPTLTGITALDTEVVSAQLQSAWSPLTRVVMLAGLLTLLVLGTALLRRRLLAGRQVTQTVTWDCGYARPTPRMQYTASSFAQPLTDMFRIILHTRQRVEMPADLFPRGASLHTETPDTFRRKVYQPCFGIVRQALERVRRVQHGHLQLYVLYIVLTLIALLVWKLR